MVGIHWYKCAVMGGNVKTAELVKSLTSIDYEGNAGFDLELIKPTQSVSIL